jgi:Flp pilus assembly protein TadG
VEERPVTELGSRRAARRRRGCTIWRNRKGTAAIEFAFVAPALFAFVMGTVSYGGYFWMASSLQQLANDAARSAVAGLTDSERQSLAQNTFNAEISNYSMLSQTLATVNYQGSGESFAISVSYDASSTPFWAASGLLPMPPTTIVRSAAVKLGGY